LRTPGGAANAIAFPSGSGTFTWRTPFGRFDRFVRDALGSPRESLPRRDGLGLPEEPRVPVGAGVEIGNRDTGEEVGDSAHLKDERRGPPLLQRSTCGLIGTGSLERKGNVGDVNERTQQCGGDPSAAA
jgi:hypothetical protein